MSTANHLAICFKSKLCYSPYVLVSGAIMSDLCVSYIDSPDKIPAKVYVLKKVVHSKSLISNPSNNLSTEVDDIFAILQSVRDVPVEN